MSNRIQAKIHSHRGHTIAAEQHEIGFKIEGVETLHYCKVFIDGKLYATSTARHLPEILQLAKEHVEHMDVGFYEDLD